MGGSRGDDGALDRPGVDLVSVVSIRAMASSLGLAKDTVTRAVRRLRDLGVVVAVQARASSGVFEAGSYRLAVPVACIAVACPSAPPVAPPAARSSSARCSSGQLSLALRGLRARLVFVGRFAPRSLFRQVPADWWELS